MQWCQTGTDAAKTANEKTLTTTGIFKVNLTEISLKIVHNNKIQCVSLCLLDLYHFTKVPVVLIFSVYRMYPT